MYGNFNIYAIHLLVISSTEDSCRRPSVLSVRISASLKPDAADWRTASIASSIPSSSRSTLDSSQYLRVSSLGPRERVTKRANPSPTVSDQHSSFCDLLWECLQELFSLPRKHNTLLYARSTMAFLPRSSGPIQTIGRSPLGGPTWIPSQVQRHGRALGRH